MSVKYHVLALGAGGVRGFLHVGALQELERKCGHSLQKQFYRGVYGSSIGSILATAIAFGMNATQIHTIAKKRLHAKQIVPSFGSISVRMVLDEKGCTTMDGFERILLEGFDSAGIDIRNKTLQDARIPLRIITSNITRGIPSVFQGHVPVLTALKASCCLPILFRPVEYRESLYVDGDVLCPVILNAIPSVIHEDVLVLNLRQHHIGITPRSLKEYNPVEYLYKLYKLSSSYQYRKVNHSSSIDLVYQNVSSISDISADIEDDMIFTGQCIVRDFFRV